jgi:hypothetical protein
MVNASDIITYAGVPLAVVGVLPSLYTFVRSLVTLRDVKKTLKHNGIVALARGSYLSGIIELEMPRISLATLERDEAEYFEMSQHSSTLKGGSWTIFNWRELVIGMKVLRLQYHDELVVPQAEVELEALVAFLLDRGAEVDTMGWSDLRGSGLWTPIGTRLLIAPDGTGRSVLSVAGSEDSEGMLSLKLQWLPEWDVRGLDSLPPYWLAIDGPEDEDTEDLGIVKKSESHSEQEKTADSNTEDSEDTKRESFLEKSPAISSSGHLRAPSPPSHGHHHSHQSHHDRKPSQGSLSRPDTRLTTHSFATTALTHAMPAGGPLRVKLSSSGVDQIIATHSKLRFRPRHLRQYGGVEGSNSTALWFACAATALGAPRGGLWAFTVPPAITEFAQIDSIPCGGTISWSLLSAFQIRMMCYRKSKKTNVFDNEIYV